MSPHIDVTMSSSRRLWLARRVRTLFLAGAIYGAGLLVLGNADQPAWAAIVVDGSMSDWGVVPGPYSAGTSQWTPSAGISFLQEDQNPSVSYLNPGYGGQFFDLEAIYFTQQSNTAFFAVVGGFPLAGFNGYVPGDFAIDFGSNGSYDFGVQTTGTHLLYKNPTWSVPVLWGSSAPLAMTSGTSLGAVPFGYQPTLYTANNHYAFEIGVPTSLFGTYWPTSGTLDMTLHWTMACGNDAIDMRVIQQLIPPPPPTPPSPPVIPEPSGLLLFGAGLLGPAAARWPSRLLRRHRSA